MSLEPLRTAIRTQVEAEAGRQRARVEAERDTRLAEARAEAAALLERARLEGRTIATRERARRRGAAQRRAHELVLQARGALFDELRRRARTEALRLRADPAYPTLIDRLGETARTQLGADAELVTDPPDTGGVSASSGDRSVDYTLAALVDRTIEGLDGEVERLWQR